METSLRNAAAWGADTVLLVPAVVNENVRYSDAYARSVVQIKKLIPLAEKLKVKICVENVWNKFLLSPMEFAQYVDQFKSPYVAAYFDVGNILLYGYPQDWIRTLGKRIAKVHLKDFKNQNNALIRKRVPEFVDLREGDLDWKEVHKALGEIGYSSYATVELPGGDAKYLGEVSRRVDLILNGE
jgi:hexulose-6-phosphate isomerase